MVKGVNHENKKYYQCKECLMYYLEKSISKKCELFCKKNKACNIDLIKYAVEIDSKKNVCDVDWEGDGKSKCC